MNSPHSKSLAALKTIAEWLILSNFVGIIAAVSAIVMIIRLEERQASLIAQLQQSQPLPQP